MGAFSSSDSVADLASVLPAMDVSSSVVRCRAASLSPDRIFTIDVAPGVLRVRRNIAPGWERENPHVQRWSVELRHAVESLVETIARYGDVGSVPVSVLAACDPDAVELVVEEWQRFGRRDIRRAREMVADCRSTLGLGEAPVPRGAVTVFSARSRRNMLLAYASVDWSGFVAASGEGDRLAAMVTLTYPGGDWARWAPDGATVKRHLRAFRSALERKLGPCPGGWKMEFQRRGAPHFHLYLVVPRGGEFACWVSETWARIVGASGQAGVDHVKAGTNVDYGFANRCTDPKRLAAYFSKHNAAGQGVKDYQHDVPVEWLGQESVGRFWGLWRLERAVSSVPVEDVDAVQVVRLVRAWQRSLGGVEVVSARRVCRRTGEIRFRPNRRRRRRGLGYNSNGAGFILLNDPAPLVEALGRFLVSSSVDHPPGLPRALP